VRVCRGFCSFTEYFIKRGFENISIAMVLEVTMKCIPIWRNVNILFSSLATERKIRRNPRIPINPWGFWVSIISIDELFQFPK
jgi:hypothetical protein